MTKNIKLIYIDKTPHLLDIAEAKRLCLLTEVDTGDEFTNGTRNIKVIYDSTSKSWLLLNLNDSIIVKGTYKTKELLIEALFSKGFVTKVYTANASVVSNEKKKDESKIDLANLLKKYKIPFTDSDNAEAEDMRYLVVSSDNTDAIGKEVYINDEMKAYNLRGDVFGSAKILIDYELCYFLDSDDDDETQKYLVVVSSDSKLVGKIVRLKNIENDDETLYSYSSSESYLIDNKTGKQIGPCSDYSDSTVIVKV